MEPRKRKISRRKEPAKPLPVPVHSPAPTPFGETFGPPLFFAALFFLGSADIFFTTRLHGFNFRWGQVLLLLAGLPAALALLTGIKKRSPESRDQLGYLLPWVPFFLVYGLAALLSPSPFLTGIKWGWGLFNIGLAALVALSPLWGDQLKKGFYWALVAIVSLIWVEAISLYAFAALTRVQDLGPGMPGAVTFLGFPIGYAQVSFKYLGFQTYRPCAFYYEPSYTGCAVTFSFFLWFFLDSKRNPGRAGWFPALAVSAMALTSSRTGILSAILFLIGVLGFSFFRKESAALRRSIVKSALIAALLLGLFYCLPDGRRYLQFLAGPLGTSTPNRIHNANSSEGNRLSNAKESLRLWMRHPVLGNGVTPQVGENNSQGLSQFSMMTWSEIGLESGTLGVLAFLFALLSNMWKAWKASRDFNLKAIVMAAWLIHFSVHFLLSQTFPRLDYWLLFFLSIRLLENRAVSPAQLRNRG